MHDVNGKKYPYTTGMAAAKKAKNKKKNKK